MIRKEVCHWKEWTQIEVSFPPKEKSEILPLNCPTSKTIVITLHKQRMDRLKGNPGWQQYSLQKKSKILPSTPRSLPTCLSPQLILNRSQHILPPRDQFNHDLGMVRSSPPHNHSNHLARLQTSLHRCLTLCKIRHSPLLPRLYPHSKSLSPPPGTTAANLFAC